MDPVTARIEALEFMAAFGLLAYASDYRGSGWDPLWCMDQRPSGEGRWALRVA